MAKAKTTKKAAPKAKKSGKTKSIGVKAAKIRAKASKAGHTGYDALVKLVDHPLVSDLLAIGAMAAVSAIAGDKGEKLGASGRTTTRSVKAAGKAAATAIGQRILDEFKEVKKTARKSAAKRAVKKVVKKA
jgi:hypothetical protein